MEDILGLDVRALDRARISRDPRFDGKFFIAVTSTGIYCRPICPVRSPKRNHIRYYATAAAAAAAGYRPCLRCRPEAAPGTPAWLGTSAVVRRALRLIDEGLLDHSSVDDLAARLGIGSRHLHRLFVQHVGASPVVVAQTRRLHFAKRLLDDTNLPITEIALAAGFGSLRRFNSAFHETYGRAPRDVRRHTPHAAHDRDEVVLRLAFRPPYDWRGVRDFLAARVVQGLERVDEGGYSRTVSTGNGHVIIVVRATEDANALELRVRGVSLSTLLQLSSNARRVFDLASDPAKIALAFQSDPLLGSLVARWPGLRIPGAWDPFECAVRAIFGQQLSLSAGCTLLARLVSRFGTALSVPEDGLTHLFPTANVLAAADLRGLGLTTAKAKALRALARAVADAHLRFDGTADEVVDSLTKLPGIGKWTAHYIALRALQEPDAFPASDLGLRRAAAPHSAPLRPEELEAMAEKWRPWRGYAAIYLWRSCTENQGRRKHRTGSALIRKVS
jgi:AraC family transcriptional regulator, regulatory protein of adaptative response / DNA-3-methyladenine glycosylase II